MKKKTFLIYLALIFAVTSIFAINMLIYNNQQDIWQNHIDTNFKIINDEDGNVINLIETPEQLAGAMAYSNNVNADNHGTYFKSPTFRLNSDINLSGKDWNPQANYNVLDGNGFSILNLKINLSNKDKLGFVTENYGTIQNLFFININVTSTYPNTSDTRVGGIAGYNMGSIINCEIISGKINGTTPSVNNRMVGGICGNNIGTIKSCKNRATISQGKHIGGICGKQDYVANTTIIIENCYNYGQVKSNGDDWARVGGICGEVTSGTLRYCYNSGVIDSNSTSAGNASVGGIVGYSYIQISYCQNFGRVIGGNSDTRDSHVGGIVGYSNAGVSYCSNAGFIHAYAKAVETINKTTTSNKSSISYSFYGIDDIFNPTSYSIYFYNNDYYNYAAINKTGNEKYVSTVEQHNIIPAYAGGIVGYTEQSVTNSYNIGEVTGGQENFTYSAYYTSYFYLEIPGDNMWGWTTDSDQKTIEFKIDFKPILYYDAINGNKNAQRTMSMSTNEYKSIGEYQSQINYIKSKSQSTEGTTDLSTLTVTENNIKFETGDITYKMQLTKTTSGYNFTPSITNKTYSTSNTYSIKVTIPNISYSEYNEDAITPSALGSTTVWLQNSAINDGLPYINGLYW